MPCPNCRNQIDENDIYCRHCGQRLIPEPNTQEGHFSHSESDYLWEHLLHSEKIFTGRNNFFLVAESVFIGSYTTIAKMTNMSDVMLVIAFLGLSFTLAWLYVSWRLYYNLGKLNDKVNIPAYKKLQEERSGFSANFVLGILLPLATLIGWVLLFYSSFYLNLRGFTPPSS